MPTALELAEQQSKHIDKLNSIIADNYDKIAKLNKALDEQIKINSDNQLLIVNQSAEIASHKEYIAILEQNINTLTNNIKMLERL